MQCAETVKIGACYFLSVVLFASMVWSQTGDVKGWNAIRWGMTVSQAKTALGSQAKDPTDEQKQGSKWPIRIVVNDIKLDDEIRGTALIETKPDSNFISAVSIEAAQFEDSAAHREYAFSKLKKLLTAKYGTPKSATAEEVIWTFPSTSITLSRIESGVGLGFVTVFYEALDKKAMDAL